MMKTLSIQILLTLAVVCLVNGQYFSSSEGVSLPRNGKRSFLSNLFGSETNQNADTNNKLAATYRRLLLSKEKVQPARHYDYQSDIPNDPITKELLLNYLINELHKSDADLEDK